MWLPSAAEASLIYMSASEVAAAAAAAAASASRGGGGGGAGVFSIKFPIPKDLLCAVPIKYLVNSSERNTHARTLADDRVYTRALSPLLSCEFADF